MKRRIGKKSVWLFLMISALIMGGLPMQVECATLPFKDVPTDVWYYNDVKIAFESGLINGKSSEVFGPNDNLTYAEAAKLAACMHQQKTGASPIMMQGEPWYQVYVDYCYKNGIIYNTYEWNTPATRGAYMDMFSRALPEKYLQEINNIDYGAIPDVSWEHPYSEAIYSMYRVGIAQGVDDAHNCNPDSNVKRSEVAAILTRMMDNTKRLSFTLTEPEVGFDVVEDTVQEYVEFELLDTPIGKLYYPGRWKGDVAATTITVSKGYAVDITGRTRSGSVKLFTIYIDTGMTNGFEIGYVDGVEVRIDVPDMSIDGWTETDKNTAYGMQDDINYIIGQIISMPGYSEYIEETIQDFMLVNTPIGKLYYPIRWKGDVAAKELTVKQGYAVDISGRTRSGTVKLFTIHIGTDIVDGFSIGYVDGEEVRIDVKDLFLNNWAETDKDIIYRMQDDVNYIIEQIGDWKGFSKYGPIVKDEIKYDDNEENKDNLDENEYEVEIEEEIEYADFLLIDTPVGKLYYSSRWEGMASAKIISVSTGFAAEVYGKTNSGTAKLYTLYIGTGTTNGFVLGYVDGEEIRFDVVELSMNGWTESDKDTVYEMQEEVNYIIYQIAEMSGFSETYVNVETNEKYLLLTTPIGKLYYPERWKDQVITEELTVSIGYVAEVYGKINSQTVKLYTIYIGDVEKADFVIGSINGQEIGFTVYEESMNGWPASDQETIYAMIDDINYIMGQIFEMSGFNSN